MRPALLVVLAVPLFACGGVAQSRDVSDGGATGTGGDASRDASSASDATFPRDAAPDSGGCMTLGCDVDAFPGVPCPTTAPTPGAACSFPPESCEYGTSGVVPCNQVFECQQGTWHVVFQGQCPSLDAATGCPATFAEAADAGASGCPTASCEYPEGYCMCLEVCSVGQKRPYSGGAWYCAPATAACPSPRPDLGTPCSQDAGACLYGVTCCQPGEELECVGGVWTGYPVGTCP